MNAIIKSMRLDYYRFSAAGPRGMVITIVVPLVYAAVFGSAAEASAIIYPFVVILMVMFSMNVFTMERSNDHRKVNGLIPVSRRSQVCGRYLFVVLMDCCAAAELLACNLIIGMLHGGIWSTDDLVYIAIWVCFGVVEQAVLLPLLYRYEVSKVLRAATFIIFGITMMIMVGTWWIPKETVMSTLEWLSAHATSAAAAINSIAVAGSVAAMCVSLAASIRIYRNTDL